MQADIEALREKHGRIFRATIVLDQPGAEPQELPVIYRAPRFSDWERIQPSLNKGEQDEANQLLMREIVVWPNKVEVMRTLQAAPLAVRRFIDEAKLLDFFGARTRVTIEEL